MERSEWDTTASVVRGHEPGACEVCIACGYGLRGQRADDVCPECGTSVARSMAGGGLVHSSAAYVRRLHVMARVEFWASLAPVGGGVLCIAAAGLSNNLAKPEFVLVTLLILVAAAQIVSCGVMWIASEAEPGVLQFEKRGLRWGLRISSATLVTCALGIPTVGIFYENLPRGLVDSVLGLLFWAAPLSWGARYVLWMTLLARIAARIPDRVLHDRLVLWRWLGPVVAVFGSVAFYLGPLVVFVVYMNGISRLCRGLRDVRRAMRERAAAPVWRPPGEPREEGADAGVAPTEGEGAGT